MLQTLWTGVIRYLVYHPFPFCTSSYTLLLQHSEAPCFWKWLVLIAHPAVRLVSRPWSRLEYNNQQSSPIYSPLTVLPSHWFLHLLSRCLYTKFLFNTTLSHTNTQLEAISLVRHTCVDMPHTPLKTILLLWQSSGLSCQYPIWFPSPCDRQTEKD